MKLGGKFKNNGDGTAFFQISQNSPENLENNVFKNKSSNLYILILIL